MGTKRFYCLNPRKKKKRLITDLFGQIGDIHWLNIGGLSFKYYPETKKRAIKAMFQSKSVPQTKLGKKVKTGFLCLQYNYFRVKLEISNFDAAIVWNGTDISAAAKISMNQVDPEGVNYSNFPRDIKPSGTIFPEPKQPS